MKTLIVIFAFLITIPAFGQNQFSVNSGRDFFSVSTEYNLYNVASPIMEAYATPHNIQLQTPQNETCGSCHGNAEIFLTEDKVNPEELEANRDVIVESVPPSLSEITE